MWKRILLAANISAGLWAQSGVPDFQKDIAPVFAKNCLSCHGAQVHLGALRLDSLEAAVKVVQPGKPADSPLYQRITGVGGKARMPMGKAPLVTADLELIRNWITSVRVQKHWAFIPPVRPALPRVQDAKWAVNPIDRFILARLEKEGLKPSPEVDRTTLLRRASLDLTGLPPTPEEVDAFVNDKSPKAWEKQVDRLLASPHYGEKWGRHWLDAARYADSDGYEKDKQRQVWFYRDWVINAFNRNMPYNQFIIEQIAGDLLPRATQDQIVATGFLRNSMINEEGGIEPEQFRMEAMFDRIDAIGKGILGVTVQCSQCHDHKFDPIKQEEYYRIFAFLNNADEADANVYTPVEQMKRAEIYRRTRELEAGLQRRGPDWQKRMDAWESSVSANQPQWTVVRPEIDRISDGGQKYTPLDDGSFLAQGYAPTKHTVKMTVKTEAKNITAFRLELLNDPNLPMGGPGRSVVGTCALTEFGVEASPADGSTKPAKIKFARATADYNQPVKDLEKIFDDKKGLVRVTGPIDFAIDGDSTTAWGIDAGPGQRNQPRVAVFDTATPVGFDGGTILTFSLAQNHGGWNSDDNQNNNLGRLRLSYTTTPGAEAGQVPANVRQILAIPRPRRTPLQLQAVFSYWRTTVPEWRDTNETIAGIWRTYPEGSSQLVLSDRGRMRETHLLKRGDFLQPGKTVEPGVPAILNPLPEGAPRNRLTFAKWLVDRQSPTTARSFVNRMWQQYFGTGIVATAEDFGRQSEAPSHPELLDWLAVEFMDRGWDIKAMQKLIVTSASYRQSSRLTPELTAMDPYNRLIARGPRLRVEAEIVRDISLAASGLLDPKMGGPSVYAPAPDFLFQPPVSYGPKIWDEEHGANRYRRAIYTFRYRSIPYPMLQTFDAPVGESSCVRRAVSNTPLQALTTLNEPLFVEAARALAARTLREAGATDEQRISYAMRRCVARKPVPAELTELLALLKREEQGIGLKQAHEMVAGQTLPAGTTEVQFAAWTVVSRVLLNLDETITKE
jgi:hypothetical protein